MSELTDQFDKGYEAGRKSMLGVPMTPEQQEDFQKHASFEDIIYPVMRWLDNNHHPHTRIILDSRSAELVEGLKTYINKVFND